MNIINHGAFNTLQSVLCSYSRLTSPLCSQNVPSSSSYTVTRVSTTVPVDITPAGRSAWIAMATAPRARGPTQTTARRARTPRLCATAESV